MYTICNIPPKCLLMLNYIAYDLYVIMNIYFPTGGTDDKNFYNMQKNVYDLNLVKVYID